MLFILRFTDDPEKLGLRAELLPSHLIWLGERQSTVLVAGSLKPEPGSPPVGALWIVEAQSRSEVEAVFQTDPFWVQGLRRGYEILLWSKAFPDRRVPV
jgi:uncharacterized protein YciI